MNKDNELINKEFRRLNNQIKELKEDKNWLTIQFIISWVLIICLVGTMNYILIGSIL